ncbi:MAG: abortive infection family protein [Corynebacterium sp.]|nr:abortive infection family protein [Corynebacterium sp.]
MTRNIASKQHYEYLLTNAVTELACACRRCSDDGVHFAFQAFGFIEYTQLTKDESIKTICPAIFEGYLRHIDLKDSLQLERLMSVFEMTLNAARELEDFDPGDALNSWFVHTIPSVRRVLQRIGWHLANKDGQYWLEKSEVYDGKLLQVIRTLDGAENNHNLQDSFEWTGDFTIAPDTQICKHRSFIEEFTFRLLKSLDEEPDPKDLMGNLGKLHSALVLHPSERAESIKRATGLPSLDELDKKINKLLNNVIAIPANVGSLRNDAPTAHRSPYPPQLFTRRMAKLSYDATMAWAEFISAYFLEELSERQRFY